MSDAIKTKECSKCKEIKEVSEFYKCHGICKYCIYLSHQEPEYKAYQSKYRKTNSCKQSQAKHHKTQKYKDTQKRFKKSEKYRIYMIKYRQTEAYKIGNYKKQRRYATLFPEIRAVHQAIHRVVKSGRLPDPTKLVCIYCGNKAKQYHHPNGYDKEHRFDVVPTCYKCHVHIHHYGLSSSGTKPVTEPSIIVLSEVPEETEP